MAAIFQKRAARSNKAMLTGSQISGISGGSKVKMASTKKILSESNLTGSFLDTLIFKNDGERCQTFCRGNPITNAGKRKQMFKMLAIVLIPIFALLGVSSSYFVNALQSYIASAEIRQDLFLSREIGVFLRMFQRERDMSALYASRIGPDTKDKLLKRYEDTDQALKNLTFWPVKASNWRPEFQTKADFANYLNKHRYELDLTSPTSRSEIEFYSINIDTFIDWLYDSVSEARSENIWQSLVAYQEIIVTSENIGKERAFGTTFYALGYFKSREDYLLFLEAQDVANTTFASARQLSDLAFDIYDKRLTENEDVFSTIRTMRYEIRSNQTPETDGSLQYADWWYENMSFYQDVIREVQTSIGDRIDMLLEEKERSDVNKIIVFSLVFSLFVVLCPLIVLAVYALTSQIQRYSINIATKTKDLKQEQQRTNELLYQMLPRSVAERLKCNEEVHGELFRESTICFGDVVGFTQIASTSSPLQVVHMLNKLFTCFDKRIEDHDVYKVETIGDAYMVVSGVPRPNGNKHAEEIATLALDLMNSIEKLRIPHMPGRKFQLRIGCHSGPVVAGVVGTKMPRYCLFGESVNVAAKMESLGKPGMIQITQSTHDILFNFGGYTMQERTDDGAKDDPLLASVFHGIYRTYWLLDSEGFRCTTEPSKSSTSDFSDVCSPGSP